MSYADESVLGPIEMNDDDLKTPVELLQDLLKREGLTPVQFGRRMGYTHPHQDAYKILTLGQFGVHKQRRVAREFGLPLDYFQNPAETKQRDEYLRRTYADFLKHDVAKDCDADTLETIRLMPFPKKLPTLRSYVGVALALLGRYTEAQIARSLADADELLEMAKEEEPPRAKTLSRARPKKASASAKSSTAAKKPSTKKATKPKNKSKPRR